MDNRKLGWIAIALGVVALIVALGGRARPMGWYNNGPQQWNSPQGNFQQGPQGNFGPQQGAGPQQGTGPQQGPQGNFGRAQRMGPRGRFGNEHGMMGRGHGFFFFPFMLIGGLFRFALIALLIALVARWFLRRRGHQDPPPPAAPSGPGPEQPPYTGGTQAL